MKERIEKLRERVWSFETIREKDFFFALVDIIADLIHKVEEFEPEHITEEDVTRYGLEERAQSRLQQAVERDELAQKLVEAIFDWREAPNLSPAKMVMLAEQLKEKLNAPPK